MFLIQFDVKVEKICANSKCTEKHKKIVKLDAYDHIDINLRED